jgi:UDP-N-acetylmuramyl pentapeptide phosphotransferase/UDP-N-acetylglucosamine-1-phosphate transferase
MEFNHLILAVLFIIICVIGLNLFIRYAHRFGLSDQPNQRSSHDYYVVRGGGVIFGLSWLLACAYERSLFSYFNLGLLILMIVGFLDDLKGLSSLVRLFFQFVSVFLLMRHFDLFESHGAIWLLVLAVLFTYLINVFNFMDGINGILGLYSLTVLLLLLHVGFITPGYDFSFVLLFTSVLSFLFFNFRSKALVFSGDVGSLSISYLLIGGLVNLIIENRANATGFHFTLFLVIPVSIFLMDSFTTILHRLWLRENIFKSHRFHLYQIITPGIIKSHLIVSSLYFILQFFITFLLWDEDDIHVIILFLLSLLLIFFLLRLLLLSKAKQITGR